MAVANQTTFRTAMLSAAAKDDIFGGVTEDQFAPAYLNVLGNDPGGAHLYSLYQGPWISSTLQIPVVTSATLLSGAAVSFGSITGSVTYQSTSASDSFFQHLAQGAVGHDTFYYVAQMANGAASLARVTVDITGVNDAPTVDAAGSASIQDTTAAETQATLGGSVAGHDVDDGAVLTYSMSNLQEHGFGTFTFDSLAHTWSFVDTPSAVDSLAAGETGTATADFTVTDEWGASATTTLTINVTGVNDPAAISGNDTGSVTEDTGTPATGTLVCADRDHDQSAFQVPASLQGLYGTFTFTAAGVWSYTLDDTNSTVNALNTGGTLQDQLGVTSVDGTASDTIIVTINGVTDPVTPPPDTNPVTQYQVNYGIDVVNGLNTITGFDSNDQLQVSGNISLVGIANNGTDTTVTFHIDQGNNEQDFNVILLGFVGLDPANIV